MTVTIPAAVIEAKRRVGIALAEMGYGDAEVTIKVDVEGLPFVLALPPELPGAICWKAYSLVSDLMPYGHACWSCWNDAAEAAKNVTFLDMLTGNEDYRIAVAREHRCVEGDCPQPDAPKQPPSELLVPNRG